MKLKEVLRTCWEQIRQAVIDRAIGQFRERLSLVVTTGGGHTEHRFDSCFVFMVLHGRPPS